MPSHTGTHHKLSYCFVVYSVSMHRGVCILYVTLSGQKCHNVNYQPLISFSFRLDWVLKYLQYPECFADFVDRVAAPTADYAQGKVACTLCAKRFNTKTNFRSVDYLHINISMALRGRLCIRNRSGHVVKTGQTEDELLALVLASVPNWRDTLSLRAQPAQPGQ